MYIKRDMTSRLLTSHAFIQVLLGPRQCGKSTLFAALFAENTARGSKTRKLNEITFDDFQMRELANKDPALFLQQFETPLLLDEIQYVPNLFPELKKRIDQYKRSQVFQHKKAKDPQPLFCLTGSNQILMDKNIKESLAGRASYFNLNTLTVHEILQALPHTSIQDILFKGGWPELHTNHHLSVTTYLNDYIQSYVEKDIILSAGIQKMSAFLTVLRLCAARTGQETDYTDIQKDSGIAAVTVKDWIGILERADIVYQLRPYFNNLNKRLIKRSKLYFLDTGLAARLQGWSEMLPLLNSPQIGGLFETLVLAEIVKFIRNTGKDWELFFGRSKDGQEVDFIIKTAQGKITVIEAKYAIHGVSRSVELPPIFAKAFGEQTPVIVVTSGGKKLKLGANTFALPLAHLYDYLCEIG